jgi:tetratricopeptide (TPR) repeat protein
VAERPQEAEQAFRRALPLWQELAQATPAQPEYRHNLAATYQNLGLLLLRRGAATHAEQAYRDALAQYDKLGTDFPTYHNHEKDRNLTRENLAQLTLVKPFLEDALEQREALRLESGDQNQAAGVHLREALDRHEHRKNDFLDQDAYVRLLAAKRNRLAWFLARCPDVQVRNPVLAVELAKGAVEQAPRQGAYWNTLGAANYRAGDWNGSIAALEQSMRLRQGGDAFDWLFLAMSHHQLQHADEAVAYLEKAVKWIEQAEKGQSENPSLQVHWQVDRRNADLLRREAEEIIRGKVPK